MTISTVIVGLYVVLLFVISWASRKLTTGKAENYVLAGRRMTTPLITVSIVGLAVGGASTIGGAEQAYVKGISAGWYTAAWGLGAIVMGLTVAKRYRRLQITTVPEMLERYYDKKSRIAGIVIQIMVQLCVMSLQYVAGGTILAALLPDVFTVTTGMIMSAIVFIGVTMMGGMWSASISNLLNVTLKYISISAAAYMAVVMMGGTAAIEAQAPMPHMFDLVDGVGGMTILTWIVTLITVNLSLQSIIQISLGAKTVGIARKGFILGGLIMLPIGFISAYLGVIAAELYSGLAPALALPKLIVSLHPLLAGLTLAALWAADVSTACNLLLSSGTLFSQDIYKRFINPNVTDEKYTLITKIAIVVMGLMTFIFALTISGIIATLMQGLSLMAAFAVIVLMTLFAPKYCSRIGAFYTLVAAVVTLLAWNFVPAVRIVPHVIYLEWIVCSITFGVCTLVSRQAIKTDAALEGETAEEGMVNSLN